MPLRPLLTYLSKPPFKRNSMKIFTKKNFLLQGLLLISLFLTAAVSSFAANDLQTHHPYVSEGAWAKVSPYLMPEEHPLKARLDKMFSKARVLKNINTLWIAGFTITKPQKYTGVIVTTHKKMPGYIFKMYTDQQSTFARCPEYVDWVDRASGADYVRENIQALGWEAYFKTPHKWIYALPPLPAGSNSLSQKNFILVEEDMLLLSEQKNKEKWNSKTVSLLLLDMIFHLVATTGLIDGCKPSNIPFCKDGKMAFIDTQWHHHKPAGFHKLFRILPKKFWGYWQSLIDEQKDSAEAETLAPPLA